jgi:hypothetical protein
MGKGYAEGPAAEEAQRRLEEQERGAVDVHDDEREAVFGATEGDPEPHFLGWLGDVDPDALFEAGEAWGLSVRRIKP